SLTFYHADGLGSINKSTDASATVVLSRQYDAFGNVLVGAQTGYAFTGREWDLESGIHYFRGRYYDARGGRFLSEDPIGFLGDDTNLYRYVWNSPLNWVDPLGFQGKKPRVTTSGLAVKKLVEMMKDQDTQRNEQCFVVCQVPGKEPFATGTTYGTPDDCP